MKSARFKENSPEKRTEEGNSTHLISVPAAAAAGISLAAFEDDDDGGTTCSTRVRSLLVRRRRTKDKDSLSLPAAVANRTRSGKRGEGDPIP